MGGRVGHGDKRTDERDETGQPDGWDSTDGRDGTGQTDGTRQTDRTRHMARHGTDVTARDRWDGV